MVTHAAWRKRADDIKQAYEAGETNLTRLAERFGTSRDTVRRSLIRKGVTPNPGLMKYRKGRSSAIRGVTAYGLGEYFGTIPTTSPELREAIEGLAPKTFTEARHAERQKARVEPSAEVVTEVERLFGSVDGAKPRRLKPWEKRVLKLEAQVSDLQDQVRLLEARLPQVTWVAPAASGSSLSYWSFPAGGEL